MKKFDVIVLGENHHWTPIFRPFRFLMSSRLFLNGKNWKWTEREYVPSLYFSLMALWALLGNGNSCSVIFSLFSDLSSIISVSSRNFPLVSDCICIEYSSKWKSNIQVFRNAWLVILLWKNIMENKKSAEAGSNPNELSDEIQKISTTRRILPQVRSSIHNIPQKKNSFIINFRFWQQRPKI